MLLMMLLQTPANPPANEAILAGGIWAEVSGRSRQVAQLNAPFTCRPASFRSAFGLKQT